MFFFHFQKVLVRNESRAEVNLSFLKDGDADDCLQWGKGPVAKLAAFGLATSMQ